VLHLRKHSCYYFRGGSKGREKRWPAPGEREEDKPQCWYCTCLRI